MTFAMVVAAAHPLILTVSHVLPVAKSFLCGQSRRLFLPVANAPSRQPTTLVSLML